jgi:Ca-activated chloride channel homolog
MRSRSGLLRLVPSVLFALLLAALLPGERARSQPGTMSVHDLGLAWLAREQKSDGHWDADGEMGPAASTGLSVLAFLGNGETHKIGKYRKTVRGALKYLKTVQGPAGRFSAAHAAKPVRDHAVATYAMVEAYRLTGSPLFKDSAQRAVDRLLAWRVASGGWSATPGMTEAVETTAWAVMALVAAEQAGRLKVSASFKDDVVKLLSRLTGKNGRVSPREGVPGDLCSTAMSALVRILIDAPVTDEARVLQRSSPRWSEQGEEVFDTLYWYFGARAVFLTGGEPLKAWQAAITEPLRDRQRGHGALCGSWDPAGPWAVRAGRVLTTALCAMCLQNYHYRHIRWSGSRIGPFVVRVGAFGGHHNPRPSTGETREPIDSPYGDVFFKHYGVNPFVDTEDDRLSTFAIDVDTASYTIARRYLRDGNLPAAASVRVEEFVNAFRSNDPPPESGTFRLVAEGMPSPFGGPRYHLLRLGLRARDVARADRRPANLTFVVDTSGSMSRENRLGLVKRALRLLVSRLRVTDRIALVVYGTRGEVRLKHTTNHDAILEAIDTLEANGSTNAEEGLYLGFTEARLAYSERTINRVILCSDGVANVGKSGPESILAAVGNEARAGVSLTTIGFGMGNYNDVLMEKLAEHGDGSYAYVDTMNEARRIFVENLEGTLQTVAKDTKVQVEFDPLVVSRYRLLGYENRDVADKDFRKDDVDAGEVGAGQTVTALYEIKLHRDAPGEKLGTFRVRYKMPDEDRVVEEAVPIARAMLTAPPSRQLRRDAAVAEFAEILRGSYWARDGSLEKVVEYLEPLTQNVTPIDAPLVELLAMVKAAAKLKTPGKAEPPEERPRFPEDD